ncbi:hypothetical protein [Bacillus niameyensis]|uniref:hypothetical protein n=1 Tax=Bacillus niameyensis TaxID=1522308 RepID=UPI000AFCB4B1|nr:hypothetical protein [Bacillus niameyensis]
MNSKYSNFKGDFFEGENTNGNLDKYHLEVITTISGAGKKAQVSSSATIRIGAMYYFGNIPAQDVILTDTLTIPTFTASIVAE